MLRPFKQLGKDTLVYGAGDLLRRSVGFFLIPLYTRYLVPADYGYLELLSIMATVLAIVGSQGLGTSFFRHYVDASRSGNRAINELVSTAAIYLVVSAAILFGVGALVAETLSHILLGTYSFSNHVRIVLLGCFLACAALIPLQYFRANMRSFDYTLVATVQFTVMICSNVLLVAFWKLGVMGILLGTALGNTTALLLGTLKIRKIIRMQISASLLKSLLSFGIPLVPGSLSLWVLQVSDRFFLGRLASPDELGLYALASRFASLISIAIIGPFRMAWMPISFRLADSEVGRKSLARMPTYLLLVLTWSGLVIVAGSPAVIRFIASPDYWEAARPITLLTCANIAYGMFVVFTFGAYYKKKTGRIAAVILCGALLNIVGNVMLIPRYGMMGAATSSLLSYVFIVGATVVFSQRVYYIEYEARRLFAIAGLFGVLAFVVSRMAAGADLSGLLVNGAVVVVFPVLLWCVRFYSREEIEAIERMVRNLFTLRT